MPVNEFARETKLINYDGIRELCTEKKNVAMFLKAHRKNDIQMTSTWEETVEKM